MIPTRRDFKFKLPKDRALDWHNEGRHVTAFLNTLSVFFPVGERFFIAAVRNYRDQIQDPELQRAVTAFIGQEAMHGREHEDYNELLAEAGLPVVRQEQEIKALLDWVQKHLPQSTQLSATIALEHFTAFLADRVLSDERVVGKGDPAFAKLWNWHALEETEHKAVAFDVWKAVFKPSVRSYAARTSGLLLASIIFLALVAKNYRENITADPKAGNHLKGLAALGKMLFVSPGVFSKSVIPWLDYFKPGFHPWDHQNAHYLQQLEGFSVDADDDLALTPTLKLAA